MEIKISFAEIGSYVKEHYGKTVTVSHKSARELRVGYGKSALLKLMSVGVNIGIDKVESSAVTVSHGGGLGVDVVVAGALTYLRNKMPEISNGITPLKDNHIRVDFSAIDRTKPVFEAIALRDVKVLEDAILVTLRLK